MCLVCDNLLLAYYLLWRMSDLGYGDSSVGIKRRVCLCLNPWVWIPWAHIKPGQEVRVSVILVTLWWGGRPRQADPCELTNSWPVHTGNKTQRQSPEKGRGSMPRLFSASCVHHTDIDKGNTHATNTLRKTEKHCGPWWAPPGGENRWWREVSHGGADGCMYCGKRWSWRRDSSDGHERQTVRHTVAQQGQWGIRELKHLQTQTLNKLLSHRITWV